MMQTLERGGVRLAYQEAGSGGVPLLFVPGGSCDWWSFHEQLDHFATNQRVVSLDLRGHGQSDKPEQDYSIRGYTDDVAWTIDELELDRPVVIGHSMGGAIALQLAADRPDLVRALVLVDPSPVNDNRVGFQKMLNAMAEHGVDSTRRRAFGNFFLDRHDPALLAEICQRAAAVPDRVFTAEIASLRDWDGGATARRCLVPVLHIAAARPACSPSALRALIPSVVSGQTVGAGHFNMLEVPDQVNSMIERFLEHYVDQPQQPR
ncbi:MAG: alpha/beta hydrolase [Actinomycetia bacterium]|nr:alpha/beta hydrolase [Actinomycetes bacterium]